MNSAPVSSLLDDKLLAGLNMSPMSTQNAKRCHEKGNILRSECKKTTLWPKCLFTHGPKVCMFFVYDMATTQSNCAAIHSYSQLPHSFFPGFRSSSNSAGSSSCAPSVLLGVDAKNGGLQQLRKFFTNSVAGWLLHTIICKSFTR